MSELLHLAGAALTFLTAAVTAWALHTRAKDRAADRAAKMTATPAQLEALKSLPPLDPLLVLIVAAAVLHVAVAARPAYAFVRTQVAPAVERVILAARKKPVPPGKCGPDCRDDCKCPLGKCECASAPPATPKPRPKISAGELAAVTTYAGPVNFCDGLW